MSMQGRSLTRHFHIETRQHEILNLDLGEGIPRRMLVFGLIVTATWILLLAPVLGVPNKFTFSFYLMPPVVFAYFGFQESTSQPRRRNITQWAVKVRYILTGHRPIISLGVRSAYRNEYIDMGERIRTESIIRRIVPWMVAPEWDREENTIHNGEIQTGRPISFSQSTTLYGFDRMEKIRASRRAA